MSAFGSADWVLIGRQVANHIWQSTLFAVLAGLLAVSLRKNHARTRHWLWMVASVKFLVPFSLIVALGGRLGPSLAPRAVAPQIPVVAEQIAQPFALSDSGIVVSPPVPQRPNPLPIVLAAVWFCGFAAILVNWQRKWRRVAKIVGSSAPLCEGREVEALRRLQWDGTPRLRLVSSAARSEPGIFGIFRPVLWLPKGIGNHLSESQLEAILAHELCHARRRDNLLAAIHMVVATAFWFHPLVWWLGVRLEEERERACDEEVVRLTAEPRAYAEGVLKVCEFYLTLPVFCAAGVTGADLKKRIENIMANRLVRELNFGKRVLLAAAAVTAIAVPITVGWSRVAQAAAQATPDSATIAAGTASKEVVAASQEPSAATQVTANPATPSSQSSPPVADSAPKPAEFEVASVKRAERCGLDRTIDAGSVALRGVPLKPVLMEAFKAKWHQIEGPSWLETDCFDISGTIPDGATRDQLPAMLQALLTGRFKLVAHKEDRTLSGYALVVDKDGPKFKEDDPKTNFLDGKWLFGMNGHGALGGVMTMATLATKLSRQGYGPVQDLTGLTGKYDIMITWTPDKALEPRAVGATAPAATPPGADIPAPESSSLFAAVRSLGLRLERRNVQVQFLVIDHIERNPTEN